MLCLYLCWVSGIGKDDGIMYHCVVETRVFMCGGNDTCIFVIVSGIGKEEEGMYRCIVENQFGREDKSAYITITGIGMNAENSMSLQQNKQYGIILLSFRTNIPCKTNK